MKKMEAEQVYVGDGFSVLLWDGNRGDHMDLRLHKDGLRRDEISWVPLFLNGGWEVCHDFEAIKPFVLTPDNPYGDPEYRPGGVYRSFCLEDNTRRLCVFPAAKNGGVEERDFGQQLVAGVAGVVRVPKGGLFVVGGGAFEHEGQEFNGPMVIRAVTDDLRINVPAGVMGAAVWEKKAA